MIPVIVLAGALLMFGPPKAHPHLRSPVTFKSHGPCGDLLAAPDSTLESQPGVTVLRARPGEIVRLRIRYGETVVVRPRYK